MSGIEIIVILFGAFLGYWIVSKFITEKPKQITDLPDESAAQCGPGSAFGSQDGGRAVPPSWHEVLNVHANAPIDEIRTAYEVLMSQYHPDKVATLGEELRVLAERKSKEITEAYRAALKLHGVEP